MWLTCARVMAVCCAASALLIAASAPGPNAAGPLGGLPRTTAMAPTTEGPPAPVAPSVGDTRANLQAAFTSEVNAKEHYLAFAKRADREGYAAVARLFRACAEAEQVHARRYVEAIAWTGAEARAVLERIAVGTTAENLQTALGRETHEVTLYDPALLARARADHQAIAVRSIVFALAAEREHARLLAAALDELEVRAAGQPLYVCPVCGKTAGLRDFKKCPTCFTAAGRFTRVD